MQNMTRPLKQWLCRNRDNPYPSKLEKEILARDSQMTNTQVSNWFANARRRLKNAVKGDNIPWSTRVKKYNSSVPGNAELLSISSDDSSLFDSDDNEDSFTYTEELTPEPAATRVGFSPVVDREDPPPTDDVVVPSRSQTPTSGFFAPSGLESEFHRPFRECMQGPQNKFKQTILQRYLNDTCHPAAPTHVDMEMSAFNKTRSRKPSGSIGSRDYEEMSTASSAAESHFYYDVDPVDELEAAARRRRISGDVRRQDDIHWKEISAAMALTSLARGSSRYPFH